MILPSSEKEQGFYSSGITQVRIIAPSWKLSGSGMFFMGSCFADYLYDEYSSADLNAGTSPFGNIYNPASLAGAAEMLAGPKDAVKPEDCFSPDAYDDGQYRHFMFHSRKTAASAGVLAAVLNSELSTAANYISSSEAAVVTLGTAFVYRLGTGETVNNCHKLPPDRFTRSMLSIEDAERALHGMVRSLRTINPGLKIILSLSPVRHLRDNAAENSLSKAVLRCAIDRVCSVDDGLWYFPSFEIMMDELRDYRWYGDDLCHPSAKAVSFIVSRFIGSIYERKFIEFLKEYAPVQRDLKHKPFNHDSDEYRMFLKNAVDKKNSLKKRFPDFFI